ncbi:MAG: Ig-like domain-containing protein [Gemmatimonadaceae bacterium]|nr:Ig-like domain-containing protein [Gemmatimonadaceae bacterium]
MRLIGVSAVALLSACGESGVSAPLPADNIAGVSATGLTAVAGQALAQPVEVRVSAAGQPLANVSVTFAVTAGGGAVTPASATTDNNGIARTSWTLGRTAGTNTLTASAGTTTTTISATGTAGRAASVTLAAGDAQAAPAGTALATSPAVRVTDANNNPVAGASVTFSVVSGGGRVTDAVRTTNAQGLAAVTQWTLGTSAGTQQLSATVGEPGVANNPILFNATALAGAAAQIAAVSATSQTGTAGLQVATPPSVRVTDANGNPVGAVQVTFSVTAGGGTLTSSAVNTNAQGIATVGSWLLGTTAGTNTVTASITGVTPVTFTATGNAGAASQMLVSAGQGQRAQINRAVATAPAVVIRDAFGNPVSGVAVTYAIGQGGGTVVGGRATSDAQGIAAVGAWFMGETPGTNTLTATATGLASITFTATADPGRPTSMTANSATNQSAQAGQAVAEPPSVIIRDIAGNPVPGVSVSFAVTTGNGSVVGGAATTSASGVATVSSWILGTTSGINRVTATAAGLPSVVFTATGTAGAPANVVITAGNAQVALRDSLVPVRPAVRVTDANGNNVSGVTVTFEVASGGGAVVGGVVTTDSIGVATVGGWRLGALSDQRLTATVSGTGTITGNPVTFTAVSGTALIITSSSPQTLGTPFAVTVRLIDASGATVSLANVPLSLSTSAGAITPTSATLGSGGTVTFNVTVTGGAAGPRNIFVNVLGTSILQGVVAVTFN